MENGMRRGVFGSRLFLQLFLSIILIGAITLLHQENNMLYYHTSTLKTEISNKLQSLLQNQIPINQIPTIKQPTIEAITKVELLRTHSELNSPTPHSDIDENQNVNDVIREHSPSPPPPPSPPLSSPSLPLLIPPIIMSTSLSSSSIRIKNWFDEATTEEEEYFKEKMKMKQKMEKEMWRTALSGSDEEVLVIVSGDEYPYSVWQSRVLLKSLREVNQTNILRILNTNLLSDHQSYFYDAELLNRHQHIDGDDDDDGGDDDMNEEEGAIREDVKNDLDVLLRTNKWKDWYIGDSSTFLCRSYYNDPDWYPPLNRIGGLIEFFRYMNESKMTKYENISTIVLLDQDMIALKRFNLNVERQKGFSHRSTILSFSVTMIEHFATQNVSIIDVQDSAVPLVIHRDDLQMILSDWLDITIGILREKNESVLPQREKWVSEMYGYCLASARVIFHVHFPSHFELFPPFTPMIEADDPYIIHYAYAIDYPEFHFSKHDHKGGAPPLPFPSLPPSASNDVELFISELQRYLSILSWH